MLVFNDYNQFKKYYNEDEKAFIFTEHGELADIEINFEIPSHMRKILKIVANDVQSDYGLSGNSIICNNLDCQALDFGYIKCESIINAESIRAIKIDAKNIDKVGCITCTRIYCSNLNAVELNILKKAVLGIANVDTIKGIYAKCKNDDKLVVMTASVMAEKIVCNIIDVASVVNTGEIYFEKEANIDVAEINRKIVGEGNLISQSLWVGKVFFDVNEDESETTTYTDVDYSETDLEDEEIGLVKCPSIQADNLISRYLVVDYYDIKDADVEEKITCTENAVGNFAKSKKIYLSKGGTFKQIACDDLISCGQLTVKEELSVERIKFDDLKVNTLLANEAIGNNLKAGSVLTENTLRVNNIEAKTLVAELVVTNLKTFKVNTCEAKFDSKNSKSDVNEYTA